MNQIQEYSLMPTNFQEMIQFADIVAKSDLAPKDYKHKPGNVMLAVQLGMEINLKPMAAIQNIAVINGRPSLWGDAMLGVVRASGLLEVFKEEIDPVTMTATCRIKRRGFHESIITFTKEDAQKAGLWGKTGPWSNYPKRMLGLRARGFALRDQFPDILKGIQSAEEQTDIIQPANRQPYQDAEVVNQTVTVSQLIEGKKDEPAITTVDETKEDERTLYDHESFEEIRTEFDKDPEKMKLITKRENLDAISELSIRFYEPIMEAMRA